MNYHQIPVWVVIVIAGLMHFYNTSKTKELLKRTGGIIRSRNDLLLVKEIINISMQLAIYYIALSIMFVAVLGFLVIKGYSFFSAIGQLFIFGIVTLPMGLIGKHFEDKVRQMEIQSSDPLLQDTYNRYLIQWKEPRFKLPD
jgi:hypothetical protein